MNKPVHIAPNCLNCGKPIQAQRFCGACGQEHLAQMYTFKELAGHYAEDFLSLDSRLVRSLWPLLTRPGFLTQQYRLGRRAQFIRPLRLYLLSSIVFFTIFLLRYDPSGAINIDSASNDDDEPIVGLSESAQDSSATDSGDADNRTSISLFRIPGMPRVNDWLEAREEKLEAMTPEEAIRLLINGAVRHSPKAIFLLVPAIAWILKLLYVRRSRFYMEHFIFALHWHSFLFVLFILVMFIPWGWLSVILVLVSPIYLLIALRRYYEQGWIRTILKHQLVMNSYLILLPLFATALAVLAALTV